MISGIEPASERKGKLVVAFSNDDGASVGVEFASTTQKTATAIMGICASTIGDRTGRPVTSPCPDPRRVCSSILQSRLQRRRHYDARRADAR